MSRGPQIRGAEYYDILHMVADKNIPYSIIAAKWGRHPAAIGNFVLHHKDEIDEIVKDQASKIGDNWLLIKDLRCRELADKYQFLNDQLSEIRHLAETDEKYEVDLKLVLKITERLQSLLKQGAEENGDLPNRAPNAGPGPGDVGWEIEHG